MQKLNLNPQLFEKVSTLIKTGCCNCYEENCLLLDDGDTHICPQLITPSRIVCRYFLESVLPGDKTLLKRITELYDRLFFSWSFFIGTCIQPIEIFL